MYAIANSVQTYLQKLCDLVYTNHFSDIYVLLWYLQISKERSSEVTDLSVPAGWMAKDDCIASIRY